MAKPLDVRIGDLRQHLQYALEVENFTIPPYLCALYSIKEGTNAEAASIIHSVVMEEMLHMALVVNLLNAVGGEARVNDPNPIMGYKNPLPYSAGTFKVSLLKFSPEAIKTFMKIEQPEEKGAPPEGVGFKTIGQFYAAVREELKAIEKECVENGTTVFTGNPDMQITPEHYYGGAGRLWPIEGLEDAERAIDEIVDQGEGASPPGRPRVRPHGSLLAKVESHTDQLQRIASVGSQDDENEYLQTLFSGAEEPPHYYRFEEIWKERYYGKDDTPENGPATGPLLPVRWNAVYNMRPNPKAADYPEGSSIRGKLDDFNLCYMRLLDRLQECFTGRPKSFTAVVGDMYEIRHRAIELMRIPSGEGETAVGPSFERIVDHKRGRPA